MCKFVKGFTLKEGISTTDLKTITIDGYHLRSACVDQINRIPVMAPILAPLFGVLFLRGCISLKNRT
jgi:hypothetical protein